MKSCLSCNKILTNIKLKKFCSRECTYKYSRKLPDILCKTCNNIIPKRYKSTIYCSRDCSSQDRKRYVDLNCKVCNRVYTVLPYESKTRLFCSRVCASKGKSQRQKEDKIDKKCISCGDIFYVHKYRVNAKFCSKECHYNNGRIKLWCITMRGWQNAGKILHFQ